MPFTHKTRREIPLPSLPPLLFPFNKPFMIFFSLSFLSSVCCSGGTFTNGKNDEVEMPLALTHKGWREERLFYFCIGLFGESRSQSPKKDAAAAASFLPRRPTSPWMEGGGTMVLSLSLLPLPVTKVEEDGTVFFWQLRGGWEKEEVPSSDERTVKHRNRNPLPWHRASFFSTGPYLGTKILLVS